MFGPKDQATINEVWNRLSSFVWARCGYCAATPASEIDGQSLVEQTSELCWEFLKGAKTAKVVTRNGKNIPAKPQLFECRNTDDPLGIHISLTIGTVGSGNAAAVYGRAADFAALYGLEFRCRVYVSVSELENFASTLEAKSTEINQPASSLRDRIVEYHTENPWAKRKDIEAAVRGNISGTMFNTSWKVAASKHPSLSAGGRPKANKP